MYKNQILARELKKNIEIIDRSFEANNLQIMQMSVQPCGEDDADCNIYLELSTISGNTIPNDIVIKINLYDEDEELFMVEECPIDKDDFNGYDTFRILCYRDSTTLKYVNRGRLYVIQS